VLDALYFHDGWGFLEGMEIQIGDTVTRITNVDYVANEITTEDSLEWQKGDSVNYPYIGKAPDIGRYDR
jgi:hypothetical protein